jgi:tRNA pseudouridine(55) synthase
MDGLLVIDKPVGLTSHDVVARMRRALGERRIGHTGTLDPNASGVLPLVIGRATRLAKFLSGGYKTYEALVRLGTSTDTYDAEGTPVGATWTGPLPARETIEAALDAFRGTFLQQPPAYSAKKIDGERSYNIARGARPGRPDRPALPAPVSVTVRALDLVSLSGEDVTLRIDYATPLEFAEQSREDALEAMLPMEAMLPHFAQVVLTDETLLNALHGRNISAGGAFGALTGPVRLVDQMGQLVGIGEPTDVPGILHPAVVLR